MPKKKLNVLFICGWYPSRVLKGNGIFIKRHAEAVQLLHNVYIIHITSDKSNSNNIELDFKTIDGVKTYIAYLKPTNNIFLKQLRYYKAYLKIKNALPKIDIIHLNHCFPLGIIAVFEKFKNKIPFITSEHWSGYQFPNNKKINFYKKKALRFILNQASYICPVSTNLEESMIKFGIKGKYLPVPNVVDTDFFKPKIIKNKNFEITHISDMGNECKNVIGILNVISKLEKKIPNLTFNLIGNNSEQHSEEIKNLGLKSINITNYLEPIDIVSYIQKSNVFVLFSNYENLPCVILESFSCGTQVISTNVGGIGEYFPENFGSLIDIKDEISLEQKILELYNSKTTSSKETMHSYCVENFGNLAIAQKFSNIYFSTLE